MIVISVPEGHRQVSLSVDRNGAPMISTRRTPGDLWHPLRPEGYVSNPVWDRLVGTAVRDDRAERRAARAEVVGMADAILTDDPFDDAADAGQHAIELALAIRAYLLS